MDHFEETVASEAIYHGRILDLYRDDVRLENGERASREWVHHSGGVSVLALTENEEVYVVRQFRYPYHRMLLEIPAGKLNPGEDPLTCGKRELEEECGLIANRYESLGYCYPTVAYTDEVIHLYLATDLHPSRQHLDADEFLDVEKMPLKTLVDLVLKNEICDSKTQIMVLKTYAKLHPATEEK